jgi:hypothetical protein
MSAVTEEPTTESATFRIGGEVFECVGHVPNWNIMRLAAAMDSNDEMKALGVMHSFVLRLVKETERTRLDEFLSEYDFEFDELEHAIGDSLVELAGRGKGSGVPRGIPPSAPTSTPSSGGSEETSPSHRVVSLSRGTVKPATPETDSSTE